jgi:hypothetical protein
MTKRTRSTLEQARANHLAYLRDCWQNCIKLAESLIGERSPDPLDQDVRRQVVFELARHFFEKHALDFVEFTMGFRRLGK